MAKNITAFGETHNISEWARKLGVTTDTMSKWFLRMPTPERAIKACQTQGVILITARGETHTIREWSDITGISYGTIISRLERGKSHEEAVAEVKIPRANTTKSQYAEDGFRYQNELEKQAETQERINYVDKTLGRYKKHKGAVKVRWCDRTSHSHTWYDTMVERSELYAFLKDPYHYLAKVVA